MSDNVVAGALEVLVDPRIELVVRRFAEISPFQELDEKCRGLLNEEQCGRLQGLNEPLRKADGETVLIPVLGDAPDPHLQVPRRRVRIEQTEMFPQLEFRLVRRAELGAVDVA